MSLIVQVPGGGAPPPPGSKGGGAPHQPPAPSRPPPAHVTQLTSSPATPHSAHLVQHHPPPAPHALAPSSFQRALPISAHRPHHLTHPRTRVAHPAASRMVISSSHPTAHLPNSPMPHLPNAPLPISMAPSPAHQLLPTSINSPSHIPQGGAIPPAFLPRLPLQHLPPRPLPRGVPLPTTPHPRELIPQAALDTNILPPHAFRKLLRPASSHTDEDTEAPEPAAVGRRQAIMSPKHRERRSCFTNVALQDHNYCAAPPPSPPRSPTPPPSPFPLSAAMGLPPHVASALTSEPALLSSEGDTKSFTFGLPGYPPAPGAAGPACLGSYPSPHYSGPPAPQARSPLHRLKQTIEEAGVGPMTPLAEAKLRERRGEAEARAEKEESAERAEVEEPDGGEETETAPEDTQDDQQEDSITRCICEFLHDDGYMICCDKCGVWQHVVCMGLDRNNIPEEYMCERCNPRPVDRRKAKQLQKNREKEIYQKLNPKAAQYALPLDSSDEEKNPKGLGFPKAKKVFTSMASRGKLVPKKPFDSKKMEKKNIKKNHKRRSGVKTTSESGKTSLDSPEGRPVTKTSETSPKKPSPRKNVRRKSTTDEGSDEEEQETSLRSWIDNYEEAVTNHYSPELRSRLQAVKLPANFFKPKDVNGIRERCNVSLRGNGLKVLTANNFIPSQTPIIECRGKYMLGLPGNAHRSRSTPFTLSHAITPEVEVVVDGKTYGNDSRYCRRATERRGEANAVVRHHLDKGSLHLYIVASRNIDRNQEILLPPAEVARSNGSVSMEEELQQMRRAEVRAAAVLNGGAERRRPASSGGLKRRVKREHVKKKREEATDSSSEEEKERPPSPRKTRSGGSGAVEEQNNHEKVEVKAEDIKKEEVEAEKEEVEVEEEALTEAKASSTKKTSRAASANLEIIIPKAEEPAARTREEEVVMSPSKSPGLDSPCSSALKSPGKPAMGLPDESRLIVGVNTINYDVSFRNKAKTREEKKMEMILKAIEQMERTEARKRNPEGGDSSSDKPEKKRRRSNSIKTHKSDLNNVDSNLDASSADESSAGGKASKKGRGKRTSALAARRRSRAKSGDSSAPSDADCLDTEARVAEEAAREFKFPRHKRHTGVLETGDVDDDVSRQYLRGSRSPPGIANHLLRSSSGGAKVPDNSKYARQPSASSSASSERSPAILSLTTQDSLPTPPPLAATPGCSAKKRWLRAAMEADIEEQGSPSTVSPEPDYTDYTPLKKRRLANYRETEEEARAASEKEVADTMNNLPTTVNEKVMALPNGLKKRLISNLVLEAVLDRAMEDFQDRREDNAEDRTEDNPEDSTEDNAEDKTENTTEDTDLRNTSDDVEKVEKKPSDAKTETQDDLTDGDEKGGCNKHNNEEPSSKLETFKESFEDVNEAGRSTEEFTSNKEDASDETKTEEVNPPEILEDEQEVGKKKDETSENMQENCHESVVDCVDDMDAIKESPKAPEVKVQEAKAMVEAKVVVEVPEAVEKKAEPGSLTPSLAPAAAAVPTQHSVFNSYFSTNLSVEEIDRQLEARRVELAREAEQELRTSVSPADTRARQETSGSPSSEENSRPGSGDPAATARPVEEPKKRMSLADYKKRREREKGGKDSDCGGGQSTPSSRNTSPKLSPLPSGLPLSSSVRGLPDLPGLESYSGGRGGHGGHAQAAPAPHRERERHRERHRDREHHRRQEKGRSSHSSPRDARPAPAPPALPTPHPALLPPPRSAPPPAPAPEHPREDLTERLRKEFGLNIDESDGEEGEGGPALSARLQGSKEPEAPPARPVEEARHGNNSESKPRDSWDPHKAGGREGSAGQHRGSREHSLESSKVRSEESKERKKVEKVGRAMAGLPNQGGRSTTRPRTPIGSPTRRPSSGDASYHGGKERAGEVRRTSSTYPPSKNYYS